MVGKYKIEVSNNRVTFFLEVKRNITIIQGDSGTGKTTLIRLLSDYNRLGPSSGVSVKCDKECVALIPTDWKQYINSSHEKIIFLDENNSFIHSKEFAEAVSHSDNYFVLIIRDSLPQLSYSIEEIYGMRESRDSQKYVKAKHVYNEIYKLYNIEEKRSILPDIVLTEDTNSGYECFSQIFTDKCHSLGGKSFAATEIIDSKYNNKEILVIVDGSAFGSNISEFMRSAKRHGDRCVLYAPESFEYLILNSGIVPADKAVLENTFDHADSKLYSSWERFYTGYLTSITQNTPLRYTKHKLNQAYLSDGNIFKIKETLPKMIKL